ncbi:hypothetical protein [Myxococcus eversor]|uniref:hypothetical protein n=1 Tax=Myxococcus eversor TaxID=2709661 RepID=UPI0013CFB032|nr:hypothetical protein [Myxococcus eversor]
MRSQRNTHRPCTVEISAAAWNQVARLSQECYRAIQARLECVASLGATTQAKPATFQVEDLRVHYVVDARRRLVTLLEITRERGATTKGASRPTTTRAPG